MQKNQISAGRQIKRLQRMTYTLLLIWAQNCNNFVWYFYKSKYVGTSTGTLELNQDFKYLLGLALKI